MLIGVSTFELHIPYARSLKEKRKVVKGLVDRLHGRWRVSVLESDLHDLHQRAEVSVAVLARSEQEVDRMLGDLRRTVEEAGDAVLAGCNERILEAVE
jgi:uncharacterized protein YlxP (DUF503 family)